MSMDAILVLRDGTAYRGEAFGASGEVTGEVVFNTSMTGYQEILSDPSYKGQIVTMTYPLIGNYGVNDEDVESRGVFLSGMVVREYSRYYSNWRGHSSLSSFLRRHGVVGISEIDTRALTRRLRDRGSMIGVLSTEDFDLESLRAKVEQAPEMIGQDYVRAVTCGSAWKWCERIGSVGASEGNRSRVIAFDFGIKYNIIRELEKRNCSVTVVPAGADAEQVLAEEPAGLVLSNGPGDPAALEGIVKTVRKLLGELPVFGICLGHQLLARAFGGDTYKLPFGHHGANHPVKNLQTGRVEITSQNHGFAVEPGSLPDEVEVTHLSLFDDTVEGLRHRELPVFSVQYHPEAAPGPRDSRYLFDRFAEIVGKNA